MWIFCFLLFIPLMIQHFIIKGYRFDYEKKNRMALIFFFVLLTIAIMFRHKSVGNDTRNYIYLFERFTNMSWSNVGNDTIEFGYSFLNKVISLISKEPQFFLALVAIAVSVMIYPTYRRLCVDASLTIVLFCTMSTFVLMFSGVRQMLAIGVGFIAYEFTRNKKLIPFILVVLLAITFHTSAFMLAFMYPLYHSKITKRCLIAVVPALAVVFVFNKPIFSVLSMIIERYTKYESDLITTDAYAMLLLFALFTAFAFFIPDESIIDQETIGLRNFLLLSLTIQLFAPLHPLAMRMNYYYIIFIPLILPKIIEYRSERWKQVAVLGRHIMVIFFLVYFFFNAYIATASNGSLKVFPYHFFWENIG